jgi:hypothetical protein
MGDEEDGEKKESYFPHCDCTNPNAPLCTCMNFNLDKSGLFSVEQDVNVCYCFPNIICKILTSAADLFLTPWILAIHFVRIYALPAVTTFFTMIIEKFICTLNCCSVNYVDANFPPTDLSIGVKRNDAQGQRALLERKHIIINLDLFQHGIFYWFARCFCGLQEKQKEPWERIPDLEGGVGANKEEGEQMKLFDGKIDAGEIEQGNLGDCWLLSVFACIAHRHGDLIQSAFLTRRTSVCGLYRIKLYDTFNGTPSWRVFTIDDKVPVCKGTTSPRFTQASSDKVMWTLLLEKVFAKMVGSYEELNGGFCRTAFQAITGNDAISYAVDNHDRNNVKGATSFMNDVGAPDLTMDELYHVIAGALKHDCLVSCGTRSSGSRHNESANTGLVGGHAYSVLNTCRCDGEKLIQLRNPWGRAEWKGKYSDHDDSTKGWRPDQGLLSWVAGDNNGIEEEDLNKKDDDGIFWMPYSSFIQNYDLVEFCAVSRNMNSLHLNMNEDMGLVGPLYGCVEGCCSYFGTCEGVTDLWCPNKHSTLEIVQAYKDKTDLRTLGCKM